MDDQELKDGIRNGSRLALDEIYVRFFYRTSAWIKQNRGTEEDAKDVFQEALVTIFQQLRKPEFEIQHRFGTYLYTIVRNIWLKRLRDDRVLAKANDDGLEFLQEDEAPNPTALEQQEYLYRKMFLKLGEQCQQILHRFLAGESIRQITKVLQLSSENYTKKRKFQCKTQLIKLIQEDPMYKAIEA